jgi:pimeloyl-ACP methyl ester carboxylesterase
MYVHRFGTRGSLIVLIHGIPGNAQSWRAVAERLSIGHRVLVPDLIGFGESRRSSRIDELWADAQAAELEKLIDEPATIAGHDYGGPVALTLYRRRPQLFTRLALLATNTFTDTPIPLPIRAVTWPLIGPAAERILFSRPGLGIVANGHAELGDPDQIRATQVIFATALRELRDRYRPIEETLAGVAVPTTVLWGDRDQFFGVAQGERLAREIPGARLQILRGAGHFLPAERPDEIADALAA